MYTQKDHAVEDFLNYVIHVRWKDTWWWWWQQLQRRAISGFHCEVDETAFFWVIMQWVEVILYQHFRAKIL